MSVLRAGLTACFAVVFFFLPAAFIAEAFTDQWAARQIYLENCATCHGFDRTGYIGAPLTPVDLSALSEAAIRSLIRHGIHETLMPPWKCRLTLEQLRQLSFYLKQIPSEGTVTLTVRPNGSVGYVEKRLWWKDPKRIEQGRVLFEEFCMGCHHPRYEAFAPSYKDIAHDKDIRTVMGQIKFPYTSSRILGYAEQTMPKFDLTDREIESLGAYVINCRDTSVLRGE